MLLFIEDIDSVKFTNLINSKAINNDIDNELRSNWINNPNVGNNNDDKNSESDKANHNYRMQGYNIPIHIHVIYWKFY